MLRFDKQHVSGEALTFLIDYEFCVFFRKVFLIVLGRRVTLWGGNNREMTIVATLDLYFFR